MKTKLLILIVALGVAGCKPPAEEAEKTPSPKSVVEVADVKTQAVRDTLAIDGQFSIPEGAAARLAPSIAGRLVAVNVKEGDRVTKGQVLAVVDTRVLADQTRSAIAARAVADAQSRQSAENLRAADSDQKSQVRLAKVALEAAIADKEANVKQAELEVARIEAGNRRQEIAQSEQAVVQARIARDRARVEADRDAQLFKEGYVAGQQADASRAAYQTAQSTLKQAESQLDLLKAGARPEERKAAQERLNAARVVGDKKIEQARLALQQAEAGTIGVQAKASEYQAARMTAAQKAADAAAAANVQSNGQIICPIDGWVSRRFENVGDSADPATPVFEIVKSGVELDFVGQASPSDAAKLVVGLRVEFETSAGKVVAVGAVNPQTGLATIRARFGKVDFRAGEFKTVQVVLRETPGALVVPKTALVDRDGKTVVFVADGAIAKMHEVMIGPRDGDQVAILKGVKAGERVILVGQYELTEGAAIEVKSE